MFSEPSTTPAAYPAAQVPKNSPQGASSLRVCKAFSTASSNAKMATIGKK